jgi:hypothetical protein
MVWRAYAGVALGMTSQCVKTRLWASSSTSTSSPSVTCTQPHIVSGCQPKACMRHQVTGPDYSVLSSTVSHGGPGCGIKPTGVTPLW